jgi:chromosome partitioning protein
VTKRSAARASSASPPNNASAGPEKVAGASSQAAALPDRAESGSARPASKKSPPRPASPKATSPKIARVIAVANQKGGVGKSTTAVSLGASLAELGFQVLEVDLDPQGNASTGLGIRHEAREITVYDVLAVEAPIQDAVVPTPLEGLYAIPSTIDLAGAEIELVSQFSREMRLRKALEPLKTDDYDYILLDCPPSLGLLTINALAAADELIVPIQCEYYALEGLGQLLRNVRLVQQNVNTGLRLTGIVMTMYDPRTKLSEQVVQEVRKYFGERVYKTVIPRTVRLSEAPGFGQPITVYDPKSKGAQCYRDLAREVADHLPLDEPMPAFDEMPKVVVPPIESEPRSAPRPLSRPEDDIEPLELVQEPSAPEQDYDEPPAAAEVEDDVASTPLVVEEPPPDLPLEVEPPSMPSEPPMQAEAEPSAPSGSGAEEWIEALEAEARAEAEVRRLHRVPDEPSSEMTEPEPVPHEPAPEPSEVVLIRDDQGAPDAEDEVDVPDREAEGERRKKRRGLFRRGGD